MAAVRLIVTAGSARRGSLNTKLAKAAASVARERGAEVTELDLRSLELPVYDGDVEAAGMPAGALELRRLLATHDALLLSTPEYNAFATPLVINSFDWASRPPADGDLPAGLGAMAGKVAGLMSASPGAFGGIRSLSATRSFLNATLGMLVVPTQFALSQAHQAFDDDGQLKDAKQRQAVENVVQAVLKTAAALRG